MSSMTLVTPEYITDAGRLRAEAAIKDQAGKVCSQVVNRREHPSYGYTKTMIRAELSVMDGMIGLYQILTGQTAHASVPTLAKFASEDTAKRVKTAREVVRDMP
jgi:ABC-type Na+ transport system ATPase subunit NatA